MEKEIDTILHDEEVKWRQRSRAVWLKEGDRNIIFYHSRASRHRFGSFKGDESVTRLSFHKGRDL